jgi:hypothetical protein
LGPISRDRLLLLVTHEPECFEGLIQQRWRLEQGRCVAFNEAQLSDG